MILKSVLLIDDDEATNFLHSLLIKEYGITENIVISLNGEEAISTLRKLYSDKKNLPELIILDINMPNMNGWEFIDEYKNDLDLKNSDSKILMLTTSFNPADEIKAKQIVEIKLYKNKPLTIEMLNEIINS